MNRDEARIWLAQNPGKYLEREDDRTLSLCMTERGELRWKSGDPAAMLDSHRFVSPAPVLPELGEELERLVRRGRSIYSAKRWAKSIAPSSPARWICAPSRRGSRLRGRRCR